MDRLLIFAALAFFSLVCLLILKQRIFDRGIRFALWWTRFVHSPASNSVEKPFVISETQFVRFDSDYAHSLKLLWQYNQRRKLLKPSDN